MLAKKLIDEAEGTPCRPSRFWREEPATYGPRKLFFKISNFFLRLSAIYAMTGDGVLNAYRALSDSDADAVLMLGTGIATLRPLLAGHAAGLKPAISCNVALMWAAQQFLRWDALAEAGTISAQDLELFRFVETAAEAIEAIETWDDISARDEVPGRGS